MWDELYGSVDVTCECTCAAASKLRAPDVKERAHDSVLGLNDDKYNNLRTQIINMDPFPSINKAFSLATQEERQKSIVRDRDDKTEAMSFTVQATSSTPAPTSATDSLEQCTHRGKCGHDYDRCYRRVGYHNRGRGRG